MILEHVADHARFFVITRPVLNAEGLGRGDLNVIDIASVPERLENGIREAEHKDVLHRLFGQVVIDAEDLVLVEGVQADLVQLQRRAEIRAERLLDDHPRPGTEARVGRLRGDPARGQVPDDQSKIAGGTER